MKEKPNRKDFVSSKPDGTVVIDGRALDKLDEWFGLPAWPCSWPACKCSKEYAGGEFCRGSHNHASETNPT